MRAYDFTITAPHKTGSMATLAEELRSEKINIEGFCAVEHSGSVVMHVLTTNPAGTKRAITKVGYKAEREREVLVERVAEDRIGILADVTRRVADAGINLTVAYLATEGRLVLGCDDLPKLEKAWKTTPVGAAR